jgi:hypothetical protein
MKGQLASPSGACTENSLKFGHRGPCALLAIFGFRRVRIVATVCTRVAANDIAGSGGASRGFGSLHQNHLGRIGRGRASGAKNRCRMNRQVMPV